MPPEFRRVRQAVAAFAGQHRLFQRRRRLLVAVSGGPDSLALLHVLIALREEFGLELVVAHFDHQLRSGSADDLRFVREYAASLRLEAVTGEGPVRDVARRQRRGIEETARAMRYQFLAFAAEKEHADAIVTGHTADDQAESVLLHLLRGSGVRGLRGMRPVGPVPGAPGQTLLRPLLAVRRAETRTLCEALGIPWRDDPSNEDPALTRNRIRSELLPLARSLNPGIVDALLGLSESAAEAFDLIEKRSFEARPAARAPVGVLYPLEALANLPGEALILVVEREAAFLKREAEVNRTRVRDLRRVLVAGSGLVQFGDLVAEVSCGKVRIGPPIAKEPPPAAAILSVPGSTRYGDLRVDVATSALPPVEGGRSLAIASSAAHGALRIRPLTRGDRIQFRGYRRLVSDLLVNEKVPAWERRSAIAIADAEGPLAIVTAERAFLADDAAPDPDLWLRIVPLRPAPGASWTAEPPREASVASAPAGRRHPSRLAGPRTSKCPLR